MCDVTHSYVSYDSCGLLEAALSSVAWRGVLDARHLIDSCEALECHHSSEGPCEARVQPSCCLRFLQCSVCCFVCLKFVIKYCLYLETLGFVWTWQVIAVLWRNSFDNQELRIDVHACVYVCVCVCLYEIL